MEHHKEHRNLTRAFAGFLVATSLYIISNPKWFPLSAFVLPLFALSIPASIAYGGLARLTSEDDQRNPNPISAIAQILAYVPSLVGITLILWPASAVAGTTFVFSAVAWVWAVVRLRRSQSGT